MGSAVHSSIVRRSIIRLRKPILSRTMSKVAMKHSKGSRKASKKAHKRPVKSRNLRRLQRSRPKRFMNPFLCFLHEERKKAKNGHLISEWKAAHRGLGGKCRALGAGKSKFRRSGKTPAFAKFVQMSPKRKEILPEWRRAHRDLVKKWKGMNNSSKAKYVSASKHMKRSYEQHMNAYRQKRKALIKAERENRSKIRMAKMAKRFSRKRAMMLRKRNKRAKRISRK